MPADPLLNEQRILETLNNWQLLLTPNSVRSLCALVLMACYDRKVTREFMAEMIDRNQEIGITMSELEGAAKLRGAMRLLRPNVEPKEIDEKIANLCGQWRRQRQIMADKFALVTQCPTTVDRLS